MSENFTSHKMRLEQPTIIQSVITSSELTSHFAQNTDMTDNQHDSSSNFRDERYPMNPTSNESIPQARLQDRVDTNIITLDNFPNGEANISVSSVKYNMGVSSRDDNVSPPPFNPNCIHIIPRQLPTNDNHEFVDELLPFTFKLHACLNDAQFQGFEHIIHGKPKICSECTMSAHFLNLSCLDTSTHKPGTSPFSAN
jgi:hypothetical protein